MKPLDCVSFTTLLESTLPTACWDVKNAEGVRFF